MNRKEQAAASRSELVEAARRCFTASGYEATTVAAILERAGMARGALYHYFPGGKAEIFTAVFDTINEASTNGGIRSRICHHHWPAYVPGYPFSSTCATEDDFARIALADAPQIVPGQGVRGSSYALLRDQVVDASPR